MKLLTGIKPDYLANGVNILFLLLILIPLSWLGSCQNYANEYHISKDGADSNPGTERSPFLTLANAAGILEPGDICVVHTGTYRECFTPKNNGTADHPIKLIAAEGEKVVISGMEAMKNWEDAGKGIFKAQATWDLEESNFVLIDGNMGFEARFPTSSLLAIFDTESVK